MYLGKLMSSQKSVRKRGVILSTTGWDKFQKAKREFEFQNNNGSRYTYEELSECTTLSLHTISRVMGRAEGVDKLSLEYCFRAFGLELAKTDYTRPGETRTVDWGYDVDVSSFYGRNEELTHLQEWVLVERCRLVALLGIGGIGKTTLAAKFAQQAQFEFDHVIWRSLSAAVSSEALIAELVFFLSNQQENTADIKRLMYYLRSTKSLVILDNWETVLEAGHAGVYRSGYEGYGELLQQFALAEHHSTLIVTSREKPLEIAVSEAPSLGVHSLKLSGEVTVVSALLQAKKLVGTEAQKQQLSELYGHNPQALKIVATSIQDLFDGNIGEFLQQDTRVFNGIRRLLDQQFNRLSELEQTIMYWLAIYREGATFAQLRADILPTVTIADFLEALEALFWRSLIEKQSGYYILQPLLMEYVTDKLTKQIATELVTQKLSLFLNYALIKTTVENHVRESQQRFILQPIAQSLSTTFRSPLALRQQIQGILEVIREKEGKLTGYGVNNLIHLCWQMQLDISELTIGQNENKNENLHRYNFLHRNQAKSAFTPTLDLALTR